MSEVKKVVLNINDKICKEFNSYRDKIKKAQETGNSAQIAIASALYHMSNEKFEDYLNEAGYRNIGEYAQDIFGIQKTACYDAIMIMDKCGDTEKKRIADDFKGFSYTQLKYIAKNMFCIEKLGDENALETTLHQMTPDMSTRDMAKLVKEKNAKKKSDSVREENEKDSNSGDTEEQKKVNELDKAIRLLTDFYNEHGYLFVNDKSILILSIGRATKEMMLSEQD